MINYGENVSNSDKFYIILDGKVSVLVKNPLIDEWEWAMSVYKALSLWKEKEFDKRVSRAMELYYTRY